MKRSLAAWMLAAALGLGGAMSLPALAEREEWSAPADPPQAERSAGDAAPAAESPAAENPAPEPTDQDQEKQMPEGERIRIEKQLTDVREKLLNLQQEELELSIKILKVESATIKKVQDLKKLKENLEKGSMAKDVAEYRNTCLLCANLWRVMEGKYAALQHSLEYVDRKRDSMPDDLKASLDEATGTILQRRRGVLEKIAAIYEKILDDRRALSVYMSIYQMLPGDQRMTDTILKQKMVDLKNKIEGVDDKTKDGKGGGAAAQKGK